MAWFLGQKEAEVRQVFLGHKGELDLTLGPVTDFRSHRNKEIINVQCKTGGKAVKISKFATEKSIGVFAGCTTLASFKAQLDRFVGSKELSPESSSRTPVAADARCPTITPRSGIPSSAGSSVTDTTPETPNIGNVAGDITAPADTPCTSKKRTSIRKRKWPAQDPADFSVCANSNMILTMT